MTIRMIRRFLLAAVTVLALSPLAAADTARAAYEKPAHPDFPDNCSAIPDQTYLQDPRFQWADNNCSLPFNITSVHLLPGGTVQVAMRSECASVWWLRNHIYHDFVPGLEPVFQGTLYFIHPRGPDAPDTAVPTAGARLSWTQPLICDVTRRSYTYTGQSETAFSFRGGHGVILGQVTWVGGYTRATDCATCWDSPTPDWWREPIRDEVRIKRP